jgi:RNA polymerase primary sigma factor
MNLDKETTKFFKHDNAIRAYWRSIKESPALSVDEELELVEKASNGDEEAKRKLTIGHQRFIFAVAKQYAKTQDEIIDYVNEGTIGMLSAIDSYDPTRGFRFITYASYYIRRQMNAYASFTNNLLYSGNKTRYQNKVKRINREYFIENGFYPSLETVKNIIKEKYNIEVKHISDLYTITFDDIEFEREDNSTDTGREKTFNNATYSVNSYEDDINKEYIHSVLFSSLDKLNEKEKDIIQMFFGIGKYNEPVCSDDIAIKYNITTSGANAIKQRALEKLKSVLIYKLAI